MHERVFDSELLSANPFDLLIVDIGVRTVSPRYRSEIIPPELDFWIIPAKGSCQPNHIPLVPPWHVLIGYRLTKLDPLPQCLPQP
jgi:hypothetical protein